MALFIFLAVVAGGRRWDAPARAGAAVGWKQGRILLVVMGTLRWEQQSLPSPRWLWAGQAELVCLWDQGTLVGPGGGRSTQGHAGNGQEVL